ncbi:hypothetical protein [Octadecabacter ascidiaceicola]|uniref:Lipoprotein n=1 Tax=Octadecabacter ascidiaceicola TaxID=1655543 RepID=A0A238KD31_9RHOB|nr:hypothetical protein [Octadecabacter ascidiaceicola]SMX40092.1 hypothetical protein OCA8868_02268 [Octadecabacter ascidiaceicola]
MLNPSRTVALLFSATAALALSACSNLVPSTLARLSVLDPLTADPAGFAIGVETTQGVDLRENTVLLVFTATKGSSGQIRREAFTLAENRTDNMRTVYTISPEGVIEMRALQRELSTWDDGSDVSNSLALEVTADGCRVESTTPPDDPRVSIFMQLAADSPMLPLLRNAPLSEMFDVKDLAELPQCSG